MLIVVGAFGASEAPLALAIGAVVAAAPIALAAFVGTVVAIWRGPPIVEFAPEDGRRCDEQDSEPVRAYAQLRGLIGGAGHVHPARLAFPAVSWAAALVAGVRGISPALEAAGPSPIALAVAAAVGAWIFPARPYWYREVMGGGALVSPPEAVAALVAREMGEGEPGIAAVHSVGRAEPILRNERSSPSHARANVPGIMNPSDSRRAPRYSLRRTFVVEQDGRELEVGTLNVSDGGLALRWPGELPAVGERIRIRLESGFAPSGVDAVVRWHRPGADRDQAIGLELREGSARTAWREIVDLATRTVVGA